jgi:hypothetical protein
MRRDEPGFNPSTPRRVPAGECTLPVEREFPSSTWCDALADALAEVADVADTGWMLDLPHAAEAAEFRVTLDIADARWHRLHVRPRPGADTVQPVPLDSWTRSERATADLVSMASARRNYVFGIVRFAHDPGTRTIFVQRVAVAGEASGHGLARGLYAQIRSLMPGYRFRPRALTAAGQRFVASLPPGWADVHPALLEPLLTKRCSGYRILRDDGNVRTEHWAGRCRVHGVEEPAPSAPLSIGVCPQLAADDTPEQ